jgi:hypothetical protein
VGGGGGQFTSKGEFYHTQDGGTSWDLSTVNGAVAMGIDCFDRTHCVAGAIMPLTQLCTAITYKP